MIAQGDDIWKLVDPSLSENSENIISKSIASEFDDSKEIDLQQYEKYKTKQGIYKAKLNAYKEQNETFKQLIRHIQLTICAEAAIFLANEEAHPYNLLRTLKLRYASDDQAMKIQIETKYRVLCMGPENRNGLKKDLEK